MSPVVELIVWKRLCISVNRIAASSSSSFDATEVDAVDAGGTDDEAGADGDVVDPDAIDDMITVRLKGRCKMVKTPERYLSLELVLCTQNARYCIWHPTFALTIRTSYGRQTDAKSRLVGHDWEVEGSHF